MCSPAIIDPVNAFTFGAAKGVLGSIMPKPPEPPKLPGLTPPPASQTERMPNARARRISALGTGFASPTLFSGLG